MQAQQLFLIIINSFIDYMIITLLKNKKEEKREHLLIIFVC